MRNVIVITILLSMYAVVSASAGNWYVSDAGEGPWRRINGSCIRESQLLGGDFDGNGKIDVFNSRGGRWFVSYDGQTKWQRINSSSIRVADLRLGDFNGDGKTDVFNARGGKWFISYGGNTKWKRVNSSSFAVSRLRFGDYNSDGKTDVFVKWGDSWRVSFGAITPWMKIKANQPGRSDLGKYELKNGDYIGDNRRDRFRADLQGCGGSKPRPAPPDAGGGMKPSKPSCGGHYKPACSGGVCDPGLKKVGNTCYACGVHGLACCPTPTSPPGGGSCFQGVCQSGSLICQ